MTNSFGVPAWRFIIRIAVSPSLCEVGHFNGPEIRQLRSSPFCFSQEEQLNAQLWTESSREVSSNCSWLRRDNNIYRKVLRLYCQEGKTSDKARLWALLTLLHLDVGREQEDGEWYLLPEGGSHQSRQSQLPHFGNNIVLTPGLCSWHLKKGCPPYEMLFHYNYNL